MKIDFDPTKNQTNIRERGIAFDLVKHFDWDTAFIWEDTRKDYGEQRFIALGIIDERLYSLVFTPRDDMIRVISLRKANSREVQRYEKHTQIQC